MHFQYCRRWVATSSVVAALAPWAAQAASIKAVPDMVVAGNQSFQATPSQAGATVKWAVERRTYDSANGKLKTSRKNFYTATGPSASFNLADAGDDTVYVVAAEDSGVTDTETVRVFPGDRKASFIYDGTQHPDIRTYAIVPSSLSKTTRLMFVMHGDSRTASSYCDNWVQYAKNNDTIVLCPYFSESNWPDARSYNRGNVFANEANTVLNPPEKWSYTAVENIHAYARKSFKLKQKTFDIWGHSAGGQFIHRFALFRPDAKVRLWMPANAGWYLLPVESEAYPCGPVHPQLNFTHDDMIAWSLKNAVQFQGTRDTDPNDPETGGCMDDQGKGRYARGHYFHDRMVDLNAATTWQVIDVPGVAHEDDDMAPAAQQFLINYNATHP